MLESPFTLYRGSAGVMAADLGLPAAEWTLASVLKRDALGKHGFDLPLPTGN
jgi:hypothetical protein